MKKYLTLLLVVLLMAVLCFCMVSCNPDAPETPSGVNPSDDSHESDSDDSPSDTPSDNNGDSGETTAPDISGITFSDESYIYDGSEKSLSVSGTLPEGITVTYENNGKINAGEYTVTAKFYNDGIYIAGSDKTATLTIGKATVDLSKIRFISAKVSFDGNPHSLTVSGSLPEGVDVRYEGNRVRNIGKYAVKAIFEVDENNYCIPDPITATLEISRGNYASEELTYNQLSDGTYEVTGYTGDKDYLIIPDMYNGAEVTSLKSGAFSGNDVITYAYIPDTVTNIGNTVFRNCVSLTEVRLGSKLAVIGQQAFAGTALKTVVLPDTLVSIGQGAFKGTAPESITLPFIGGSRTSSNSYIGFIFGAGSYIQNSSYVPVSLKEIIISDSCTRIPANAFDGCSSVTSVIIGKGVEVIENNAFKGCSSIRSVYLPESVVSVPADTYYYNSPFVDCSEELMIVLEKVVTADFGLYWSNINENRKALVIYYKTYEDYAANGESFRDVDVTSADAASILVGGIEIAGFDGNKRSYTLNTDINSGYPEVTAAAESPAAIVITEQATYANDGTATVRIVSGDGSTGKLYTVKFIVTGSLNTKAEVVNKDGAKGVVSYVIDDGFEETANFAKEMLNKYSCLNISFAIKTSDFAALKTQTGSDGKLEYVMENGKYTYDVKQNKVDFWKGILDLGRTEIISHTHTHSFWGTNDDGGVFEYVNNQNQLLTSAEMPKGSTTKEVYASKQILEELFPSALYPSQRTVSLVEPGIMVKTSDVVVDGKTITTYKKFYDQVVKQAILNGDYIGSRSTFIATSGYDSRVNTKDKLKSIENRMNVDAFMILNNNAGTDIINWKNYIDTALNKGGWACFCIHQITPTEISSHHILESQADQLFAYTQNLGSDVWVASFTDAMLYYSEWSTAKVVSAYSDDKVIVTLTDEEENNEVYNMALTVKVNVPGTWDAAKCGDTLLDIKVDDNGTHYVYVNIVPDSGTAEIIPVK